MHRSFETLYRQHHDSVLRYFLRKTRSREDAEDLTSRVFEKAWRTYPAFEDRGDRRAHWLARISRTVLVDHWRRASPTCADLSELTIVDERADCEHHLHLADLRVRLLTGIAALTPTQRDVVVCRWVRELSIVETAATMDMSSLAVRAAQQRAFAALRTRLVA